MIRRERRLARSATGVHGLESFEAIDEVLAEPGSLPTVTVEKLAASAARIQRWLEMALVGLPTVFASGAELVEPAPGEGDVANLIFVHPAQSSGSLGISDYPRGCM